MSTKSLSFYFFGLDFVDQPWHNFNFDNNKKPGQPNINTIPFLNFCGILKNLTYHTLILAQIKYQNCAKSLKKTRFIFPLKT